MAFKLAELFVQITTKDSKFQASLKRGEKNLLAFRDKLSDVSKIARNFLIGGGIALGFFIKGASDAQEILSKFKAVFKDQAKAAEEFAETLGRAVGRSKIKLQDFLATLQDTFVPLGFAREAARKMSQQVVKLAIDLASFNNKSEPEVIRDLQSALVGNTETVRKYGIIITQATLNQELLNQGIEGGVRSATEAEKAQARLGIILQSTTDAQGDAIRTGGDFANQMKALRDEISDLSDVLGETFIPVVKKIIVGAREIIPPLIKWLKENKGLVLSVAGISAGLATFTVALGPAITAVTKLSIVLRNLGIAFAAVKAAVTAFDISNLVSIGTASAKASVQVGTLTTTLKGATLATTAFQLAIVAGVAFGGWKLGETIAELIGLDKWLLKAGRSVGLLDKEVTDLEIRQKFLTLAPKAENIPGTRDFNRKHGITPQDKKRKVKTETEAETIERELAETRRSQKEFFEDRDDEQRAMEDKIRAEKKIDAEIKAFTEKNKRREDEAKKKAAEEAKREEEQILTDLAKTAKGLQQERATEAQKAATAAAKAAPRARFLGLEQLSKTIQKQLIGAKEREEAKKKQDEANRLQKKANLDLSIFKTAVLNWLGDNPTPGGLGG